MNILSVIPARSGSKGVKNKNIIMVNSKPLIYYTIAKSLKCKLINTTFVSTDSIKIANLAKSFGAEVPFLRPKKLATDKSNVLETVLHAVRSMENYKKIKYNIILVLQPTSPLREVSDITKCIKMIMSKKYDSVITVSEYKGISPYILYSKNGNYSKLLINNNYFQRQEYQKTYFRNGLVYAIDKNILNKYKSFYGKKLGTHLIPNHRSINVDTTKDLNNLKKKFVKI